MNTNYQAQIPTASTRSFGDAAHPALPPLIPSGPRCFDIMKEERKVEEKEQRRDIKAQIMSSKSS